MSEVESSIDGSLISSVAEEFISSEEIEVHAAPTRKTAKDSSMFSFYHKINSLAEENGYNLHTLEERILKFIG
jgi:hypothetical protein